MMWVYQCLDIISTLIEAISLYFFSILFCKTPRFSTFINKWIIIGGNFALIFSLTWFSELGGYKSPLLFVLFIVLLKISYKTPLYQCIISNEISLMAGTILSENIAIFFGNFIYGENMLVVIDGTSFMRWEIYVIALLLRIFTIFIFYIVCKGFIHQLDLKDFFVITFVFIMSFVSFMYITVEHLNLQNVVDTTIYLVTTILPVVFILIFMYVKNTVYLREQEQKDRIRIAQLNQQFSYYQEKFKDEEKKLRV